MAITARWDSTETTVQGERTEVVLELSGLTEVHPTEDKLITQTLRDALPRTADADPLWERLKLDREACRLHMFVAATPDVARIKQVLDEALRQASEVIAETTAQRERAEGEARSQEETRSRQAANVRDAFRGS